MKLKAQARWRVAVYSLNSKLKKVNIPQNPKMERQVEWKQIPVHVGRQHAHNQQKPQSLTHQTGRKQGRAVLYVPVSETEETLRKNNSKRAYQLAKDLTTEKEEKATTVQDRSGNCITEERQIPNRCIEYCSELYNHKANGDPSVLNCPKTQRMTTPAFAKKWRLQYNH